MQTKPNHPGHFDSWRAWANRHHPVEARTGFARCLPVLLLTAALLASRSQAGAPPSPSFGGVTPAGAAQCELIPVARNDAPKWPFHQGPDDTIEKYLKRTQSFGMLGIAKVGQNLTRNKVRKALAEQAQAKEKK